jgi:hypothetical protein
MTTGAHSGLGAWGNRTLTAASTAKASLPLAELLLACCDGWAAPPKIAKEPDALRVTSSCLDLRVSLTQPAFVAIHYNGNSGSWSGKADKRPSNWWDCIGFGQEDAYANGMSNDWKAWDGTPWGYEGFLVDNYYALLAVLTRAGGDQTVAPHR